jgi:hypothetical protein
MLHVQPGAKRTEVAGVHGEGAAARLKVRLAAPPVDGKANAELLRFLSTRERSAPARARVHSRRRHQRGDPVGSFKRVVQAGSGARDLSGPARPGLDPMLFTQALAVIPAKAGIQRRAMDATGSRSVDARQTFAPCAAAASYAC